MFRVYEGFVFRREEGGCFGNPKPGFRVVLGSC